MSDPIPPPAKTGLIDRVTPVYKSNFSFFEAREGAVSKENEQLTGSDVLRIGEFRISQYRDNSLVIYREDGESMEVSLETLRRFWDENF